MSKRSHYLNNENLPLPSTAYSYTQEMMEDLLKSKNSLLHFVENHFTIVNVDEGEQTIKLYPAQKRILKALCKHRFVVTLASRQSGKALDVDTPIMTPTGFVRMGDLKTGDQVYGSDDKPCNVIHAFDILYNRKCYKVIFDNGSEIIADADHLWSTQANNDHETSVKTTEQIKQTLTTHHRIPKNDQYFYIKDIQEVESRPVRCISVDSPDHLYLAGKDLIPTHNSTLMCAYTLWKACFNKHQRIVIAANREDTAIEIFGRIRLAYEHLPNWLKPGVEKWGETAMKLENGSHLSVETTSMNTGRGKSANLIIIDEMAFIAPNIITQFWKSISATISSSKTAQIFVVSTANGTDNLFYQLYKEATSIDPESTDAKWHAETIGWQDVPGRGKKWKEEILASLNGDEDAFAQEYDNKFLSIGVGSIDENFIAELRHRVQAPIITLDNGHYNVFEMPDKDHIYIAGVDVSDGIGDAASVVEVFDVTDLGNIRQVAEYHNREIDPLSFTRKVYQIALQWGSPILAIERNNMGGTVVDTLVETYAYTRLLDYVPNRHDDYNRRGIFSHTNIRYDAVVNMRYWVNLLHCVHLRSPGIVEELRTFVKHPNGVWKKQQGRNIWDDRVMAMIWALFSLENGVAEKYFEIITRDRNGKVSQIRDENMFFETMPLGELKASLEGYYYDEPPPLSFDTLNINLDPEDLNYLYGSDTSQQTDPRSVPPDFGYSPGSSSS